MSFDQKPMVSRRGFVKLAGAGLTVFCAAGSREWELHGNTTTKTGKIPIALQLYSVRNDCEKDLPGTLNAVVKMGYQGVEFAGYYDHSAKDLRKMLDDLGLKCCGTHIGLDTLLGNNLSKTIKFNKTLGNTNLIVPGLPEERTSSRKAWLDTAKTFNELADKVKAQGMRVGYHNHTIEFKPMDGALPWDIFFGNTRKEVIMQFDTGNAMEGGGDPIPFLKRYPGRAITIHVKEYSSKNPKALIGEGDIKWKDVFNLCETIGGTEWYIVEYESDAYPPLQSVDLCLKNLRKMGK
jgi:sugar phosphate isomerase/epimerase